MLHEIEHAALSAADLTRQMTAYAGKGEIHHQAAAAGFTDSRDRRAAQVSNRSGLPPQLFNRRAVGVNDANVADLTEQL